MLIARKISQVSCGGWTNDGHHRRSGRKRISGIPSPTTRVHPALDSMTLKACEASQFEIDVYLKTMMSLEKLETFENIPVVYCSEDM
jgi:hypothetical protein